MTPDADAWDADIHDEPKVTAGNAEDSAGDGCTADGSAKPRRQVGILSRLAPGPSSGNSQKDKKITHFNFLLSFLKILSDQNLSAYKACNLNVNCNSFHFPACSVGVPFLTMPPSYMSFSSPPTADSNGDVQTPATTPGTGQDPMTLIMGQLFKQMAAGQIVC